MEATLKTFNTQKESTLNILNQLHAFLLQGEGLGINIDSSLVNKLDTAIKSLSDDNLKLALIGGSIVTGSTTEEVGDMLFSTTSIPNGLLYSIFL